MTKSDLIKIVHDKLVAQIPARTPIVEKYVTEAIEAFVKIVNEAVLAGEEVKLSGFGNFSLKKIKAGVVRNPKTNEKVITQGTTKIKFKISKDQIR